MWDLPGPGLEPVSPALTGRFLTTAPPGKPTPWVFDITYILEILFHCHNKVSKLQPKGQIQPSAYLCNTILLEHIMPIHLSSVYGCFHTAQQGWVITTEASWPAKLTIFTICPLREKFGDSGKKGFLFFFLNRCMIVHCGDGPRFNKYPTGGHEDVVFNL